MPRHVSLPTRAQQNLIRIATTRDFYRRKMAKKEDVDAAIIFLHGLGDQGSSWRHLTRFYNTDFFSGRSVAWEFPTAPIIPVSCNGGYEMTAWFDLWDIPVTGEAKDDREGCESTPRLPELLVSLHVCN